MDYYSVLQYCLVCILVIFLGLNIAVYFRFKLYNVYSTSCIYITLSIASLVKIIVIIIDLSHLKETTTFYLICQLIGHLFPNLCLELVSITFLHQWYEMYHYINQENTSVCSKRPLYISQVALVLLCSLVTSLEMITILQGSTNANAIVLITAQCVELVTWVVLFTLNVSLFVALKRLLRRKSQYSLPITAYFSIIIFQ